MILLLGGTSETSPMAEALARAGYSVLVSTATDIPISVGNHPNIAHRTGPLSDPQTAALVRQKGIQAIVDVTHPYASQVRSMAPRVAAMSGIPYLTFVRPGIPSPEGVQEIPTHEEAAGVACNGSGPVLLTIGSKNIEPYAREAFASETVLVIRVLPHPGPIEVCRRAGIPDDRIVTGRGPFGVEDNLQVIRHFGIQVIVTKDSGAAGGFPEKLEAARIEHCRVVVVTRPPQLCTDAFADIPTLVKELSRRLQGQIERIGNHGT